MGEGKEGEPHEPSDALYDGTHDPIHVHVDLGGSTPTERNGNIALESADAGTDGEVVMASRDTQDEVERSRTC